MFILAWRFPPWGQALLQDRRFRFVHQRGDDGIMALLQSWKQAALPQNAMQLLVGMLKSDPSARLSPEECLASSWLEPLAAAKEETRKGTEIKFECEDMETDLRERLGPNAAAKEAPTAAAKQEPTASVKEESKMV